MTRQLLIQKPWNIVVLVLLAIGYLAATQYPFDWTSNGAVLRDGVAVFERPGILRWDAGGPWQSALAADDHLAFQVHVRRYAPQQFRPARILTVSRDHWSANLTIGQDGGDLVVRVRRDGARASGTPAFRIPRVFEDRAPKRIEVVVRRNAVRVSVDDAPQLEAPLADDAVRLWNPDFQLALGNELTWQRPWIGEIVRAKVTTQATELDLLASTSLVRSGLSELLARRFALTTSDPWDAILNFIAMIPLGFLTTSCLGRRIHWPALAAWFVLICAAETLQVRLFTRRPGLPDLVLNMLGVLAGVWTYWRMSKRAAPI